MNRKIIIIGGGISGLTAGIYARKAGFETEIYESHTVAGGLCTGWNRKGYHIDGCIHWLTGTKKDSDLYRVWETTGALGGDSQVYDSEVLAATLYKGEIYRLYADPDKMEHELLRISPEDGKEIKQLTANIRLCQNLPIPVEKPVEYMSLWEKLALISKYMKTGKLMKDGHKTTIRDYLTRFRSEVIRYLFKAVMPDSMPLDTFFFSLGTRTSGNGAMPFGGSYGLAQRMKCRFEELGGKLYLGKPVSEIIIENGKATGIKLSETGEIKPAGYIVPAVDAHLLLHQLLKNNYKDEYFEKRFSQRQSYPLLSATHVALGIKADMRNRTEDILLRFEKPLKINRSSHDYCLVKQFGCDPLFCSAEKSLLTATIDDKEYDYWEKLKNDSPDLYKKEKERIAESVIGEMKTVFPEIPGNIEMIDVATPLTFNRYCGSYMGAYMSFASAPGIKSENHKGTICGIENMYLAGQWVFPDGGLPMAAIAGKFAIQRICRKEKIKWAF